MFPDMISNAKEETIMKARMIFLGLCCAVAAVSCQKADDSAPITGPVSITLSRDDIGTKTDLSVSGTGFTRVWKAGDAISIIDLTGKNEKFTLTAGAGTGTATFTNATSSYATGSSGTVRILYPYTNAEDGFRWDRSLENQGTGALADLGNYDLLYGSGYFEDGIYSAYETTLSAQCTFFKIPSGVKFLNTTGSATIEKLTLEEDANLMAVNHRPGKTALSATTETGTITLENIPLTNGALTQDVYIAFIDEGYNTYNFKLKIKLTGSTTIYTFDLPRNDYLSSDALYNLKQSNFTPQDII